MTAVQRFRPITAVVSIPNPARSRHWCDLEADAQRGAQRLRRQEVVDQSGKVASSKAREEPTTTYSLLLMRARDGKWYMAALDESRTP